MNAGKEDGASGPPPLTQHPQFALGLRLHNSGEYYEAHEAWEDIWRQEDNDEYRVFVQGLIQVTSAFHKLFVQREPVGAGKLLARGLEKLDRYPADYWGIAVGGFRDQARIAGAAMAGLEAKSPAIERFDRALIPRLEFLDG